MGGSILGSVASTVVGGALNKKSSKSAKKSAGMILPKNIRTGRSSYNTQSGEFVIDPTIRAGLDQSLKDIRSTRSMVADDYARTDAELTGLRGDIRSLRGDYESNSGAYTEAMLNPLRQAIASGRGELKRDLSRRGVAGSSFANQQMTNFDVDSGRALTDKSAEVENMRINALGDFIGMDADIIKEGIRSREGRARLTAELDNILAGRYDMMMGQEMDMLALPGGFTDAGIAKSRIHSNAEGVKNQFLIKGAGEIIGAIADERDKPTGATPPFNPYEYAP